jgi:hypothetical protein
LDAAGDAADVSPNDLAVPHQLDGRGVAFMDLFETGLLEIAVDPEGVGVHEEIIF